MIQKIIKKAQEKYEESAEEIFGDFGIDEYGAPLYKLNWGTELRNKTKDFLATSIQESVEEVLEGLRMEEDIPKKEHATDGKFEFRSVTYNDLLEIANDAWNQAVSGLNKKIDKIKGGDSKE